MNDDITTEDFSKLSLQEMEKRLTPKPEEYRVVKPKTHEEQVEEAKQLQADLEKMREELPVYHNEDLHRAGIELTESEYKKLSNTKWKWKDTGQRIYDLSVRDMMYFLEEDQIEPIVESSETADEMQKRLLKEAVVVD